MFKTSRLFSRPQRALAVAAASTLALSMTACSSSNDSADSGDADKLQVSASFYPILYLTEATGGDHVEATSVTPVNSEPHSFELAPKDITDLSEASLLFYVEGFQASLDDAVAEITGPTVVELSDVVDLEVHEGISHHHYEEEEEADHDEEEADHDEDEELSVDPHFWQDPVRMQAAAEAVAAALVEADPDNAADYEANLATLTDTLTELDESYSAGLETCERDTFITAHAAFGYMAERYGLTQVSVAGIEPDTEPAPAELAEVAEVIEETGATTVFTETATSTEVSDALAAETGATTDVLNPIGVQPEDEDYAGAMESNLTALETALGCQ